MAPEVKLSALCPCGSSNPFEACCGPYLAGEAFAPTAEALMRSRYTAYARGDADYLARSWDPQTRPKGGPDPSVKWLELKVVDTADGGPQDELGVVEFIARFSVDGQERAMRERSRFRRHEGRWVYVDAAPEAKRVGRNAPCPCGSGKKYKRCCGRR